jgi:signal transduction histidine kinase
VERLPSDEARRALGTLELRAGMAIPLVAGSKLLGVITLLSVTASRLYGPEDLHLGHELAQRAALALENARLYRTAQRAIKTRDDVMGIVAHDLRNPLGTIVLEAGLLRARVPEPDQKAAEFIQAAASRMNSLIQDLLDVAHMEAGRLRIEPVRMPVAPVVRDAVANQTPLAAASSLELRLDLAEDLPDVWADRGRLLQVFDNLVGNALKFTEPGGRITVGAAPRPGEILFKVSDTGPGIAPEDRPRVFDRFWQASKGERRGAGLGLPIVKGLVEAHGGRVWVESEPGHGSTFFFTIPAAPGAESGNAGRQHRVVGLA